VEQLVLVQLQMLLIVLMVKLVFVVLDKVDINLSNIDNTSDDDKPVSTAQLSALEFKSKLS
jgi:hypothetical protein